MIDIQSERLLNLRDAARLIPSYRAGRPTHLSTVLRLIVKGRLEGLRINRRWVTSAEALQRYAECMTEAALGETEAAPVSGRQLPIRRERELEKVDQNWTSNGLDAQVEARQATKCARFRHAAPVTRRTKQTVQLHRSGRLGLRRPGLSRSLRELITLPQWVLWKFEFRTDKWTKVPYQPKRPHIKAKADVPGTWGTFDEAWAAYWRREGLTASDTSFLRMTHTSAWMSTTACEEENSSPGRHQSSRCFDRPMAKYRPPETESSLSAEGSSPRRPGPEGRASGPDATGALEVYDHGRFFTITGDIFGDSSEILDRPDVAHKLYQMARERRPQTKVSPQLDPWLMTASAGPDVEARAIAYLATIPSAVSGQGGHDKTFYAAIKIGPGFDLPAEVALRLLLVHYNPRCTPPWSEEELRHKVEDAYKVEPARGWLLDGQRDRPAHACGSGAAPSAAGSPGSPDGPYPQFPDEPRTIAVDLFPVRRLDPRMIPAPLQPWLEDIANRGAFPLEYPTAAAIVGLSGLLGRRIAIRPKRHDNWLVTPTFGVPPLGRRESKNRQQSKKHCVRSNALAADAMEAHKDAIAAHNQQQLVTLSKRGAAKKKLEAEARKGTPDDALAELARAALASDDTPAPTCRRYLVNDATVEKLGELLEENPNRLAVHRDELSGWLRTMDRQGHEGDRGFYLEAWNGNGSYTFDRIGRGTHHIPNVCLSIFGSIQPGPLAALPDWRISQRGRRRWIHSSLSGLVLSGTLRPSSLTSTDIQTSKPRTRRTPSSRPSTALTRLLAGARSIKTEASPTSGSRRTPKISSTNGAPPSRTACDPAVSRP